MHNLDQFIVSNGRTTAVAHMKLAWRTLLVLVSTIEFTVGMDLTIVNTRRYDHCFESADESTSLVRAGPGV